MRYILSIALLVLATSVGAEEMYKWTDAEGNVHYSQTRPDPSIAVDKTLMYDEQLEHERQMRAMQLERAKVELERARREAEMAGQGMGGYPPQAAGAPAGQSQPTEMSYEDKQKLREIERDLERVSSSGIGDARSRNAQVESLMRQQEMIYSRYGGRASPRIVIQDQRGGRW